MPTKQKLNARKSTLEDFHERDNCQTPPYALDPLLPFLNPSQRIWEPAAGAGSLVAGMRNRGYTVEASELQQGQDFFQYEPPCWDVLVTNPPYSIKYDWLRRCYALGKPFALLVPVETIGAKQSQRLMERHGFEILLLDKRVNFSMPRLGFSGGGANFPVLWLCWRLLPQPVVFGRLSRAHHPNQLAFQLEAA